MRIHKAGFSVILVCLILLVGLNTLIEYETSSSLTLSVSLIISSLIFLFVVRFFRHPARNIQFSEGQVMAPADGQIVVIEEVEEDEFIHEKRIQISIFMSVWNVHINWLPMLGEVRQVLHFDGNYKAAWLPKASHENERSIIVIKPGFSGVVLIRQIAGALARRIITYSKPGQLIKPGEQLGFIRFGSRVDVLLPLDFEIKVELNQKVKGGITLLAEKSGLK